MNRWHWIISKRRILFFFFFFKSRAQIEASEPDKGLQFVYRWRKLTKYLDLFALWLSASKWGTFPLMIIRMHFLSSFSSIRHLGKLLKFSCALCFGQDTDRQEEGTLLKFKETRKLQRGGPGTGDIEYYASGGSSSLKPRSEALSQAIGNFVIAEEK